MNYFRGGYPQGVFAHASNREIAETGWECLEKYPSLFPSNQFVWKKENIKDSGGIYLINKKSVLKTLNKYRDVFSQIIGKKIDPESILQDICDADDMLRQVLNDNVALLGILFGYGKDSSLAFVKRNELLFKLHQILQNPITAHLIDQLTPESKALLPPKNYPVDKPCAPLPSPKEYKKICNELNEIVASFEGFSLEGSTFFIQEFDSPCFASLKGSAEVEELRRKYASTRNHLAEISRHQSLLEATIQKLTEKS